MVEGQYNARSQKCAPRAFRPRGRTGEKCRRSLPPRRLLRRQPFGRDGRPALVEECSDSAANCSVAAKSGSKSGNYARKPLARGRGNSKRGYERQTIQRGEQRLEAQGRAVRALRSEERGCYSPPICVRD